MDARRRRLVTPIPRSGSRVVPAARGGVELVTQAREVAAVEAGVRVAGVGAEDSLSDVPLFRLSCTHGTGEVVADLPTSGKIQLGRMWLYFNINYRKSQWGR